MPFVAVRQSAGGALSESDQPLQDIRSTGEEAERLLKALESNLPPTPTDARPAEPVFHQPIGPETSSEKDQVNPALVLLILAILFSPLILLAVYQSSGRRSSPPLSAPLGYSSSCGSASSATGRWWPVLGAADSSLLSTIRSRFCADAYINAEGAMQVASFGSWEAAESFRVRLEQATGQPFRVGLGRLPAQ